MKKTILVSIILLVTVVANAQIKVRPGLRAGLNISNFTNSEVDSRTDFYVGGFATIKFADFYTLQPEINYSRQGNKDNSSIGGLEVQYVSLTIANKFFVVKGTGLNFIVGPSIAFKVGDNIGNDDYFELESFDILFLGGLGYDFSFGLSLEARYNIGIVDILGRNVNDTIEFENLVANKFFQIGAAYKFDFKK